jgi:hypothetical protein
MLILLKKLKYNDAIIITRGNDWGIRKTSNVPAINEKRTTLTGDFANFAKAVIAIRSASPDLVIAAESKKDEIIKINVSEKKKASWEKNTVGVKIKLNTCSGLASPMKRKHNSKYAETMLLSIKFVAQQRIHCNNTPNSSDWTMVNENGLKTANKTGMTNVTAKNIVRTEITDFIFITPPFLFFAITGCGI